MRDRSRQPDDDERGRGSGRDASDTGRGWSDGSGFDRPSDQPARAHNADWQRRQPPGEGWPWGGGGGPMSSWGVGGSESTRGIGGTREGAGPGFAGRGPKGYRRSDDRIREEVSERLQDDAGVDASEISIEVRDGEVTLSGSVTDRRQKHRADDVAEACRGVSDVINVIRVIREHQSGIEGQSVSVRPPGSLPRHGRG